VGFNLVIQFKEIQFRSFFDESLKQLDFKTSFTGLCYIQSSNSASKNGNTQNDLVEYRKFLAKLHNVISHDNH
jgi:hypothetical protein